MSRNWKFYRLSVVFVMASLILAGSACWEASKGSKSETPEEILFIGNSLTYYNGGLDHHLMELVSSADPPLEIQAESFVRPGKPLEWIWEHTKAREIIAEGDYDLVVLQDALHHSGVESFHEYTRLFTEEIRAAGAEPLLFMTWARQKLSTNEISQAFGDIADELDLEVAPVGLAWARAIEERPELDMYRFDLLHPSIHGSYLAVCVFYATMFEQSPVGLTYLAAHQDGARYDDAVTEEQAAFLQRIAWETVQDYQAQD
jgi:hypothetical protein